MSFLTKFKTIQPIEYRKLSELEVEKKYPIVSLQNVETKYGITVLATIRDHRDNDSQFRVYLPKRYAGVFTDEELRQINPGEQHLVYKGKEHRTSLLDITP